MERLKPEEIAELRKAVKAAQGNRLIAGIDAVLIGAEEANRLLDEVERLRHLEPYSRCPDCNQRGLARRGEETTAGVHTCRTVGENACHRDPNRYTNHFACPNGHEWQITYWIQCRCRGCSARTER